MPDDRVTVALRSDASGSPDGRSDRPVEPSARGPDAKASGPALAAPGALFLLLPLALIAGGYWYVTGGQVMSMDDAFVEADKVGVSTDVSGIVREVDVTENQQVKAGQLLYRLDDLPVQARAGARRGSARHGPGRPQRAEGELPGYAGADQAGAERCRLLRHPIAPRAEPPELRISHPSRPSTPRTGICRTRSRALASLNQQLAAIAANLNGDPEGPVEQNPRYLDALAQRDEAARQLDHAAVRAPFAGIVTNVPSIAPGKYLAASTTAFFLVATDHAWIDANPKETELTYVRPGQPVTVTVDTYPDTNWRGTVASISPAAAEEFSLLPAQNTSGNWVKVVQRIPMRVRVDTSDKNLPPLRAGMSVEVDVDTGHRGAGRIS